MAKYKPEKHVPAQALKQPKSSKWKEPVFASSMPADGRLPLAWRFSVADKGGPFSWQTIDSASLVDILSKLPEFETKSWDQLHAAGCHPIDQADLGEVARDRLRAIQHDDIDALMSFHLTGPKRIWCIPDGHLMRVLWWDPEHKVYPLERDKADRQKRRNRR